MYAVVAIVVFYDNVEYVDYVHTVNSLEEFQEYVEKLCVDRQEENKLARGYLINYLENEDPTEIPDYVHWKVKSFDSLNDILQMEQRMRMSNTHPLGFNYENPYKYHEACYTHQFFPLEIPNAC